MMRVSVNSEDRLMTVDDFRKASTAQVRIDLLGLTFHRGDNGGVVRNDDSLLGAQHGKRALELERFIDRALHEGFHFRFAKCGKNSATKPAEKALCSCKSDTITFVAAAVEELHAFSDHHLREFLVLAGLVIVVTEYRHDGHAPHVRRQ